MSFWDREVSLWRVSRGPTSQHESIDGQRHRLVAKVMIQVRSETFTHESVNLYANALTIQGEENITSAMLSPDGKTLAVATISDIRVFTVRRRKGDEKGALRVQKIDVPNALSGEGARLVTFSPDSRWLCVVRPNSEVYVAKIQPASSATEKPHIMPRLASLKRAARHARHEKPSHGTLGDYERTIRSVVFSEDSKIIAAGDLSGCIDTWTLQNETSSQITGAAKSNGASESDADSSDDEDENAVIEGERWSPAASESPIPRMKSGITLLSFRPASPATKPQTNGVNNASLDAHDRLMVITSEHQLIEFEALSGKLSDWSRRNPRAYLPAEFRGVKDRAMGCIWDILEGRERLWLYGTSWLWMFDLLQDFPTPEEMEAEESKTSNQLVQTSKRKRDPLEDGESNRKKPNSGAGDKIPRSQMDIHLGTKMRKITGSDESQGEWVSLDQERPRVPGEDDEAYDYDEAFTAGNDATLARLRRENGSAIENGTPKKGASKGKLTSDASQVADSPKKQLVLTNGASSQPTRRWWHTYKYRDLLGIVPLNSLCGDDQEQGPSGNLEVAVIERPMWDVELPGKYVKDYE